MNRQGAKTKVARIVSGVSAIPKLFRSDSDRGCSRQGTDWLPVFSSKVRPKIPEVRQATVNQTGANDSIGLPGLDQYEGGISLSF